MTLLADRPLPRAAEGTPAFATPTIVYFATVLFVSAILRAPWSSITPAAVLWGLAGASGAAYTGIVVRRMRTQLAYRPEFEDWLFHGVLPFTGYAALALTALTATAHLREAMFGVGAAALLLLFSGIHNAWDAVAYHVLENIRKRS